MTSNSPNTPQTSSAAAPRAAADSTARLRRRLAWWAVAACTPYLMLKLLWIVGIDVGVVDIGKINRGEWVAANLATFAMDAVAAAVAHALTRPRTGRGRAWPILLPMWGATGLLGIIMIAVPLSCVGALATGSGNPFAGDDFLQGWVYAVVYGGFIVEGAVLVGAFALYAHERWGAFLRFPVRDLAAFPARGRILVRAFAGMAVLFLFAAGVLRVVWAAGSDLGMTDAWIADRDAVARWLDLTQGGLALAGAAGILVLAFGLGGGRVRVPLAAAWTGTAAAGAAGGGMGMVSALASPGSEVADRTSGLLQVVYTAEMITGLLVLTAGWYFLSHGVRHAAQAADAATGTAPAAHPARMPAA